jgi:hypothetical protein
VDGSAIAGTCRGRLCPKHSRGCSRTLIRRSRAACFWRCKGWSSPWSERLQGLDAPLGPTRTRAHQSRHARRTRNGLARISGARAPCRPHYAGDQKHDDAGTDRDQGGQREGWCEVCERVHEGARVCVSTACLSTLNAAHHPGVQASARPTAASRRSAGRQSRSVVLCARLSEGRSAGSEPHLQVKGCRYQAYGNGRCPDRGEAAGVVENKAACPGPHERA